ncbi:hypothetical protein H6F77_11675 [Microcoleus sp. FACHB-831]|uniref:hypothetical protein n=1 Tax=Microcoleus sp. FACHB-831 TaxID=2692827 RepID=UPI00168719CD|nr:hypothetical protein [Microcoleus sp. FACHB-831]MBD1921751.1 hypothetical protein [Microcoleus sp. FACHB-831]
MNEQKQIKEIFWEQQLGNKFLINSCPAMLNKDFKVLRQIKLPPFFAFQEKEQVFVIYNRDYVVEKLLRDFVIPLRGVKYQELQILLSEAYKRFKEKGELQ